MTARFKAPYGTPDQHVTAPAHNFGYHLLVAYLVSEGKQAPAIRAACALAHEQQVPKDVVNFTDAWQRRGDISSLHTGRRIDAYAAALLHYASTLQQGQQSR